MAETVFDVVARVGVELATSAGRTGSREGVYAELATRAGRERFMDDAALASREAAGTDARAAALGEAMSFHGRHDLFRAASTAAARQGRTFEPYGDGELKRYDAIEAGRPVAALREVDRERHGTLEALATREGRQAFADGGGVRSGADREIARELADPSRRDAVLRDSQALASREGRTFEPLGMLERWSRPEGQVALSEIDAAPGFSRAEVGSMMARVDAGIAAERSPAAGRRVEAGTGIER